MSDLLLDPDALSEMSDEAILAAVPDRPVASVTDIEATYGGLYTLAVVGESEYAPYLTPGAYASLVGDGEHLLAIDVDATGDEATYEGVQAMQYEAEHIPKVAHSHYGDSGVANDHSLTHRVSSNKAKTPPEYAQKRFTSWPGKVRDFVDDHPDVGLVDKLAALGEDIDPDDDVEAGDINEETQMGKLAADVSRELGGEGREALITARIRREEGGEFEWPGDIDVLNAAMRGYYLNRQVAKNDATDSTGVGTCMVTGEEGDLVGSSGDPLSYFQTKQRERFFDFDPDEAWRMHPISGDAAITVSKGDPFVKACRASTFGAEVFHLPYFPGEPDADRLRALFEVLAMLVEEAETERNDGEYRENPLALAVEYAEANEEDLRFYTVIRVEQQTGRYDVFGEAVAGNTFWPLKLANAHRDVLEGPDFGLDDEPFPVIPGWGIKDAETGGLLDDEASQTNRLSMVAGGRYVYLTFADHDGGSADDPRILAMRDLMSGTPLTIESLLEEYVERLRTVESDDDADIVPRFAAQFAQLSALAACGLVEPSGPETELYTRSPTYMTDPTDTETHRAVADGGTAETQTDAPDEPSNAERRADALDGFIQTHPALENDERRAAFLLGALVGHVGSLQSAKGRSRTLVDKHPASGLTLSTVKLVAEDAMETNANYASEGGYGTLLFKEVTSRLSDAMLMGDPEMWSLGISDIRWAYAMGVAYGVGSGGSQDDEDGGEEN